MEDKHDLDNANSVHLHGISETGNYERLTMPQYFSNIALLISQRSTCNRKHVGAVIVFNNKIVSTGYNGSPHGQPHCLDEGCVIRDGHCIRCIHAEQNAIIQLDRADTYHDLELYVTDYPCQVCAKMIAEVGIKKIHFVREYANDDKFVEDLFKSSKIEIIQEHVIL